MIPEDTKYEIKLEAIEEKQWEATIEKSFLKQQVLVTGNQGTVFLDELPDIDDQGDESQDSKHQFRGFKVQRRGVAVAEQLMVIQSLLMSLRQEVIQMKAS